jgi:hypothetical protein
MRKSAVAATLIACLITPATAEMVAKNDVAESLAIITTYGRFCVPGGTPPDILAEIQDAVGKVKDRDLINRAMVLKADEYSDIGKRAFCDKYRASVEPVFIR